MRRGGWLCAVAATLAACDPPPRAGSPEGRDWPPGTVLVVDGTPITAQEVDLASVYAERIEPRSSPAQLRRLALTNVVLPRVLAALTEPEKRAQARRRADEQAERLRATGPAGPPGPGGGFGEVLEGGWSQLGIVTWGTAMDLEPGSWSEVVEETGAFVIFRVLERRDGPVPLATLFRLDTFSFPWLDPQSARARIESAHDEHRLTIVDPGWREIVPELIQYRMGVHDR